MCWQTNKFYQIWLSLNQRMHVFSDWINDLKKEIDNKTLWMKIHRKRCRNEGSWGVGLDEGAFQIFDTQINHLKYSLIKRVYFSQSLWKPICCLEPLEIETVWLENKYLAVFVLILWEKSLNGTFICINCINKDFTQAL